MLSNLYIQLVTGPSVPYYCNNYTVKFYFNNMIIVLENLKYLIVIVMNLIM